MPDRVDRSDPTLIQREPMRLFLRTIGTLLLAVALILIILDGTRSLGENRLLIASLAETWKLLHAPSLGGFQEFLGSRLFGPLLRPVADLVLSLPAWVVLGVPGALLAWGGRSRRTRLYIRQDGI